MLLASCGNEIKFHKWPSGDYYGSYQIPEAGFYIPSMSWCCEGELLVTTVPSLGSPIVISVGASDIQTYQVVEMPHVQSAAFSKTIQKNIAFGTEIGQVSVYDINKKGLVHQLPLLPSGVKHLQYGAQDTSLAAGCKNGQICLFSSKYDVRATFYVPNSGTLSAMCCHSRLPHVLAAASPEGIVVVWDSSTGNMKLVDKPHSGSITDVAFSSTDAMATVGLDEKFIGYDLRTKECTFCCKADEQLSAVAFMPGGDQIAVATIDGKLFCYDKRVINHPIHTIVAHHPKAIRRIAFQNLPSYEDFPSGEVCELRQNESTKSNVTTVVSNTNQDQSYGNVQKSEGTLSRQPSTITTIIPDSDSDCLVPNSEEFVAYLESLQYTNVIHNRGDAANRKLVGLDCINLNRSRVCPAIAAQQITFGGAETNIRKLPGSVNIVSNQLDSPNRGMLIKLSAEEINRELDAARSDAITNWIKKLPLNSSETTTNPAAVIDQEEDITKLRKELQDVTRETIEQLAEMINREFLKIRMAVSRGFVQMEHKMNARWNEFNLALMKMAGYVSSDEGNEHEASKEEEASPDIQRISTRIPTRTSRLSKPI